MIMETLDTLPEQGKREVIVKIKERRCCDECGEDAHYKHTWLLKGTRSNPASKAYGRDDCSWCEDDCSYACRECTKKMRPPEGYVDCSIFPANERFAHMFLCWRELGAKRR
jgi:hypothetical protein